MSTTNKPVEYLDDLATIGPSDLGKLIGRSTKSIKVDVSRRPETLPPRFIIPGTRKLLWRVVDVRAWMQALADIQAEKRREAAEILRRTGSKEPLRHTSFFIAAKPIGREATKRMNEKG